MSCSAIALARRDIRCFPVTQAQAERRRLPRLQAVAAPESPVPAMSRLPSWIATLALAAAAGLASTALHAADAPAAVHAAASSRVDEMLARGVLRVGT